MPGPGSQCAPHTRGIPQFGDDRIFDACGFDHNAGGDHGQSRVGVEGVGGGVQRAGIPPGVVVAEAT